MAQVKCEALLLQHALHLSGDLAIHAGQDAIEELNDRHLGPEAPPNRAEFEPDHPGADDDQLFWRNGKAEGARRRDDRLLVDLDARQLSDIRAGRDDDRLGLERRLFAVLGFDNHASGRGDPPLPPHPIDLVLLEQERDAVDVGGDGVVLMLHHGAEIELRRPDYDPEGPKTVARLVEHLGGVEERLRRDAADVEAGSAQGLHLLDDRDLHAQLRCADRANVAAGTRADDDEVVGQVASIPVCEASPAVFAEGRVLVDSRVPGVQLARRRISAWRSARRRSASDPKSTSSPSSSVQRIECPNSSSVTAPKRSGASRRNTKRSLGDHGPEVDDRFEPVKPNDLDHAEQHRFNGLHPNDFAHCSLRGFRPASSATHASIKPSRFWAAHANTAFNFVGGSEPRSTFRRRNLDLRNELREDRMEMRGRMFVGIESNCDPVHDCDRRHLPFFAASAFEVIARGASASLTPRRGAPMAQT